jgi:hypothetical protein
VQGRGCVKKEKSFAASDENGPVVQRQESMPGAMYRAPTEKQQRQE